jgi:hypothetical protein
MTPRSRCGGSGDDGEWGGGGMKSFDASGGSVE